jgi:diaminohydroxyphosphoribosylaminopyrimidine deaminase/5-amino-6-(5-phosphoribosylamino)uracil reductase
VRVILSRHLDLPLDSQLTRTAREVPVWICHGRRAAPELILAWEGIGATLIAVDEAQATLNPASVLQALGERGLTRVYCEGGGGLAASLLEAGLVDALVGYGAGLAIGAEGRPSLAAMGISRLAEAPRFDLVECRDIGGDVLHRWTRKARA